MDENFLVQFILKSLPCEYVLFQMNLIYNTVKDIWNVHELNSMLVQEETRIKSKKNHPISYVSREGARKNTNKKHDKKRKGSLKIIESSSQIHEREHHDDICRFFRKIRHVEKDCPKHKG